MQNLNPEAMTVVESAKVEPALVSPEGEPTWPDGIRRFQFERLGYFCIDRDSAKEGRLIFNRTATLRDSWSKEQGK